MRFADPALQIALDAWRRNPVDRERAMADNAWFEERVSEERRAIFEAEVANAHAPAELPDKQTWYFKNILCQGDPVPHTFQDAFEPARLSPVQPEPHQSIVRLEDLRFPLERHGMNYTDLYECWRKRDMAVVDKFLSVWNEARDVRPAFATWKDMVLEELKAADWADRIRDRLGLGHYDPENAPIPVVLMQYTVKEVFEQAARLGVTQPFTAPTVLDGGPWPYFFPSPAGLAYGRCMPLVKTDGEHQLLAEMLHIRLPYRFDHIAAFGEIRRRLPERDMREARNDHLTVLQIESDRFDFGEEIP